MRRVIALLLASCCCSPLLARDVVQVSRCVPGSLLHAHRLEKAHVVDDFHIYYSLQGRDALQYPQDSTGDGVPDVVKDIASQLRLRNISTPRCWACARRCSRKFSARPDRSTSTC